MTDKAAISYGNSSAEVPKAAPIQRICSVWMASFLFDFQRELVSGRSARRAAIFADCGLGKPRWV